MNGSEFVIVKENAIEIPIEHVSGGIRRKRRRLTVKISIQSDPTLDARPRLTLSAPDHSR
jgi:hypothetical protein